MARVSRALLLIAAAGCGGSSSASRPVDVARARLALTEALDAWKAGKPGESLAQASPPIRVADEDWLGGGRLTSYEIAPEDQVLGDALVCRVGLTLQGASGPPVKKRVIYNVRTNPSPSVIRQE